MSQLGLVPLTVNLLMRAPQFHIRTFPFDGVTDSTRQQTGVDAALDQIVLSTTIERLERGGFVVNSSQNNDGCVW